MSFLIMTFATHGTTFVLGLRDSLSMVQASNLESEGFKKIKRSIKICHLIEKGWDKIENKAKKSLLLKKKPQIYRFEALQCLKKQINSRS